MTTKNSIILGVVVAVVAFASALVGGLMAKGGPSLGTGSYTALSSWFGNGFSAGDAEQFSVDNKGAVTAQSTTTVARSYDGFMVGGGIAPASVATNTPFTLYTHSGGPAACDASQGLLYADVTDFAPPLVASIGTSTSAVPTTNLISSTTLATSTDMVVAPAASIFVLQPGDEVMAILADNVANASSTYFARWDIEFQMHCWLIGG